MAVNSLATVTLPDRKTGIIQTKSIRDQRLVPQHVIYYDGGKDRVLYVYSLVQGQDRESPYGERKKEL